MTHQIPHRSACIARHVLACRLYKSVIAFFRTGDGLLSCVGWWFRHASQNHLGEGIKERIECLLPTTNVEDIPRYTIKTSGNSLLGAVRFRSPIQFVPDRRPDERAGICVAPRLGCLLDLMLIFSGKPDRDPGVPGLACVFLHKPNPLQIRGQDRHFRQRSQNSLDFSSLRSHCRTIVEHVVDFGKRRKLLAPRLLARKKHQLVRQSLYVPLPVFVASLVWVPAAGFVAECRNSSQNAVTSKSPRSVAYRRRLPQPYVSEPATLRILRSPCS